MNPAEHPAACNCGGNHSAIVGFDGPGNGHAVTCPVRTAATVEFEERHAHHMHILGLIRDDHGWALSRILLAERLEEAVRHVIADSPGTPETVKGYLRTALRGF